MEGDNPTSAGNQQERPINVIGILRGHTPDVLRDNRTMIWSDLRGDTQGLAERHRRPADLTGRLNNALLERNSLSGKWNNEPVPANIGEARTAVCGRAMVIPREVVPTTGRSWD